MKRNTSEKSHGVALVITLAAVVLLTVIILAFFFRAEVDRQISFSGTNQIKARMLAGSAFDIIVGQLRQQIADGSLAGPAYAQGGLSVYVPKDATYLVPRRQAGLDADSVGVNTILYVSSSGSTLDPYAAFPLQLGSSTTIDTPSRNGRKETGWYSAGPRLGSAITPAWVLLTQGKGVSTSPVLSAKPTEPDYVIGRFAYTIYDLTGLLDANVAGYPSSMEANSDRYPAFKSSQAYADLSLSTLGANADKLVSWRNPGGGGSVSAYESYIENWGQKYGFLQTTVGSNAFLSRQDFLNAVDDGIAGFSSVSPAYFTAFSLSVEAPSWSPLTPSGSSVDYATQAESGSSVNRDVPNVRFSSGTITHYRDDGTSFTYEVLTGDPSIQRRFSLAKLSWITDTGPKPGISADAIQACFGLRWDGANHRWNYVGPTGNTLQQSIAALQGAATDGREPNFFEVIQAGVLSGSIGKSAVNDSIALTTVSDKNPALQVIQIGANIIDQYDADDYPTAIRITNSQNSQPWDAFGIEDLPYPFSFYMTYYRPAAGTSVFGVANNATRDDLHVWLLSELWNPHQTSSVRTGAMDLKIGAVSGSMQAMVERASPTSIGGITYLNALSQPVGRGTTRDFSGDPSVLAYSCLPSGFREPALLNPSNSTGANGDVFSDGAASIAGFHVGYANVPDSRSPCNNAAGLEWTYAAMSFLSSTTIECSYRHPTLGWLPYARVSNLSGAGVGSGMPATYSGTPYTYVDPGSGTPFLYRSLLKPDARTSRFGLFSSPSPKTVGQTLRPARTDSGMQTHWGMPFSPAFLYTEAAATFAPYPQYGRPGIWAENNASSSILPNSYYPDPDGIVRPGDGYYGAYPQAQGTAADLPARPRILNRPFRNVAELGYAGRDQPFKNLDFFSQRSADAALLDLFSLADGADGPVVSAGKINVNAADPNVLAALLSGTALQGDASSTLSQTLAKSIAAAIVAQRGNMAPARDPADWSRWLAVQVLDNTFSGDNRRIKEQRESVIRGSVSFAQTRTWNLLIDVTAQAGRFPSSAKGAGDFLVEGSQRCWLQVAIDRFTGKIVDQKLEIITN